jgi:hypothetical protein
MKFHPCTVLKQGYPSLPSGKRVVLNSNLIGYEKELLLMDLITGIGS